MNFFIIGFFAFGVADNLFLVLIYIKGSITESEKDSQQTGATSRRVGNKYIRPLIRRGSLWTASSGSLGMTKTAPKYQNTYQTDPKPSEKFAVTRSLKDVSVIYL